LHDQLLQLLGQLRQEYDRAAESMQRFHDRPIEDGAEFFVAESARALLASTTRLETEIRRLYHDWQSRSLPSSLELRTAVDGAATTLQRLMAAVNAAAEVSRCQLQMLKPSMAASSVHQRMARTYGQAKGQGR
jgi:hypothetical protein